MENNIIKILNEELINVNSLPEEDPKEQSKEEEPKEDTKEDITEDTKEDITEEAKEDPKGEVPVYEYDTLVLGGGSSKGLMTLGSLQYAFDNYLLKNITTYIGCSAGSMICYLLAIGYTPIEIVVYICCNQLMEKMVHFNIVAMINNQGASSYNTINETFEKMTINKIGFYPTLKDLKDKFGKTLICSTYNITEQKIEYLSPDTYPNLPCITAIRMSSNLPLVFENFKYGNSVYIDGGICDNFPIHLGDKLGKKILGILITPEKKNISNDNDMGILEFIYMLMFIPISQIQEYKMQNVSDKCKVIKLHNNNLKFFNFDLSSKDKLDLFSSGYEQMKNQYE
jgi:predicted patatin/cPLA2 family phospholipase